MTSQEAYDDWSAGQSYDHYMGRWSRLIAAKFVTWVAPDPGLDWIEVGCGTGALTRAILSQAAPRLILATDKSPDFVSHAKAASADRRARFGVAEATDLPVDDDSFDIVTSALVMNFVPDIQAALTEFRRVLRPGGFLAFYVWDYPGGGMGFIDAFWKAACEIDPAAADLDESTRFPFCSPKGLAEICTAAGVAHHEIAPIEIETRFTDFEAFWYPFTLGAGPAPGYCASLSEEHREDLKRRLAERLGSQGPVSLPARAWAVKASWVLH